MTGKISRLICVLAMLERTDLHFLFGCLIIHLVLRFQLRKRTVPLPPGPRRWPLIGSALSFPMKYPGKVFVETSKQIGSKIIYHEVFGRPMVVINDLQMAKDLLEKRSLIYSSRPELTMLSIMNVDFLFAALPYGEKWRHYRRLFQQYFSPHDMEMTQEIELDFVRKSLLPKLYQDPLHFQETITSCIGGISILMAYGIPVRRDNDPLVEFVQEAFGLIALLAIPGEFFVEIFPWLRYVPEWVPGSGWRKKAKKWGTICRRALEEPFQIAQQALTEGHARKSFVSTNLEQLVNDGEEIRPIKEVAAMVYGAASETTAAALMTFILAMMKYPDVQQKAQKELDTVVGDRLPEFSDQPLLPYISAILKEVLRWNPIFPIGIFHLTEQDDIYNGYYIPANTSVTANAHAILHDEQVYKNPDLFDPERYLKDGRLDFSVPDPEIVGTFGFGRRLCPGAHIAISTLFIAASSILSLFDISSDSEKNPPASTTQLPRYLLFKPTGIISEPIPFRCKIIPRAGKNVEDILKDNMDVEVIV